MRAVAITALSGVLWVQRQSELGAGGGWLLLAGAALLLRVALRSLAVSSPCRWLFGLAVFALAVAYASHVAGARLHARLPLAWDGARARVVGAVVGLPEATATGERFLFRPEAVVGPPGELPRGLLLRVSCRAPLAPWPAERWQLSLQLRAPRGLVNPGTFDYEAWLFSQGIGGLASCIEHPGNRALPGPAPQGLDVWRARLLAALRSALSDDPASAMVAALSLGDDSGLAPAAWEVLRATGTIHLISVSGLHVSCVALGIIGLLHRLPQVGGPGSGLQRLVVELMGLVAAAVYAALAGFAVPLQRALVMLLVYSLAQLSGWPCAPTQVLAAALLAVLLLDPLAVMAQGFWLSFLAVGVLIAVGHTAVRPRSGWEAYLRPQLAMGFALAPVLFAWGVGLAPVGLIANLIAIPWVTLLTTPAALLGVLLQALGWQGGAVLCWQLAWFSLWPLWAWMCWLAEFGTIWQPALTLDEAAVLAGIASVLALMPRGLGLGLPAGIASLGLLIAPPPRLGSSEFVLTALDVGQGTAVTIETATHTLVYDTGPRFSERFEAGGAIVAPYLKARGRVAVDRLIVSHSDGDHAGGVPGLLAALPVARLFTSAPERWQGPPAEACQAGQAWRWDGVDFQILHPDGRRRFSDNDGSCVLYVASALGSALLPGDIEAAAEAVLLARRGTLRPSQVVIAPHHGSKTSSSPAFVRALKAGEVVYTVGQRNRYGFPHPRVQARWSSSGARASDTARHGAIQFAFLASGLGRRQTRVDPAPYWRWREPP